MAGGVFLFYLQPLNLSVVVGFLGNGNPYHLFRLFIIIEINYLKIKTARTGRASHSQFVSNCETVGSNQVDCPSPKRCQTTVSMDGAIMGD
jgi:hypothetical protein